MATAIARSVFRMTLRGVGPRTPASKRTFSSSGHHDDAYETAKWEKITYAGIATCTTLALYCLSKGHPHHEEPPAYSYLHIRNKEFPWGQFAGGSSPEESLVFVAKGIWFAEKFEGPDGLFEVKHH